jgi:hypothetical protein
MLEGTVPDLMDRGTQRPNAPPLQSKRDKFILINCPDFEFEITLLIDVSADNPITLFTLYYIPKIIELIVQYTNNAVRKAQDLTQPRA